MKNYYRSGILGKYANFSITTKGEVGVKEIEKMIELLEFDKKILQEQNDEEKISSLSEDQP